jgi:ATP-dependent HslUV protease ATP-binding subunit HslU
MKQLTPREIVGQLDRFIIGQNDAKRAIAIAMRNRWRRRQLPKDLRDEISPKNIIMIGPTGVGKTEIARRMAALVGAPFIKVEATKYTEVGYVGRDVESIIRDLTELGLGMVRREAAEEVRPQAEAAAEERLLDILLPTSHWAAAKEKGEAEDDEQRRATREKLRVKLKAGLFDDRMVEVEVEEKVDLGMIGGPQQEEMIGLQTMMERFMPPRRKRRRAPVREAREILVQQEADRLIDQAAVTAEALDRVQNLGVVFVDELDKIAGSESKFGPDVSRQGVQRDLLPIVEGCTVGTRYGLVRTEHILFIGAGAFTAASPSDLMPELQGRFPIRVELKDLTADEFVRILTEPDNALVKQQRAMLATEGLEVEFTDDGIRAIAEIAYRFNQRTQNIGARRLYTVIEKVTEGVSYDAPDLPPAKRSVRIDAQYVHEQLRSIMEDEEPGAGESAQTVRAALCGRPSLVTSLDPARGALPGHHGQDIMPPRVLVQVLQVWVDLHVLDVAVTKFEGPPQGSEGPRRLLELGVRARKVVVRYGVARPERDQAAVHGQAVAVAAHMGVEVAELREEFVAVAQAHKQVFEEPDVESVLVAAKSLLHPLGQRLALPRLEVPVPPIDRHTLVPGHFLWSPLECIIHQFSRNASLGRGKTAAALPAAPQGGWHTAYAVAWPRVLLIMAAVPATRGKGPQ